MTEQNAQAPKHWLIALNASPTAQHCICGVPWADHDRAIETHAALVAALQKVAGARHVLRLEQDSWSLRHPLHCRPDLLGCCVHQVVRQVAEIVGDADVEYGFYWAEEEDGYLQLGDPREVMKDSPPDEVADLLALARGEAVPS